MTIFRVFLLAILAGLGLYTAMVVARDGMDFITPFSSAVPMFGWQGQFNLDLACMFALAAIWIAWRHRFTPAGLALAVGPLLLGALYISGYLLLAGFSARGGLELVAGRRAGLADPARKPTP